MDTFDATRYSKLIVDKLKCYAANFSVDGKTIFDEPKYRLEAETAIKEVLNDAYIAGKLDGTSEQARFSMMFQGSLRSVTP